MVLSESMVWKRPSSSVSLRTPSAKKSWNSSRDNFPSSAKEEAEQLVCEQRDVPKSKIFPNKRTDGEVRPGHPEFASICQFTGNYRCMQQIPKPQAHTYLR